MICGLPVATLQHGDDQRLRLGALARLPFDGATIALWPIMPGGPKCDSVAAELACHGSL